MMEIIKEKKLTRGYKVVLLHSHKKEHVGDFDKYDIDVRNSTDRTIVTTSTGCLGLKSGEYWFNSAVKYMQRLLLLVEAREMAYHNQLCYSKTYMIDIPKEEYEDEWNNEKEKANMIEKWLVEHSEYFGKKDIRGYAIKAEFDINEIFVD